MTAIIHLCPIVWDDVRVQPTSSEIIEAMEAHRLKSQVSGVGEDYARLQYLVGLEDRLQALDPETPPIPFHQVLLRSSHLYRRAWALSRTIGAELKPATKSMLHLYLEFRPFELELEYPGNWSHVRWLFLSPDAPRHAEEIDTELTNVKGFNWSIFHDALHLVFVSLVPCLESSELMLYFHFFESFVGIQEAMLTRELGPLYPPLMNFGVLNDAPAYAEADPNAPEDAFADLILRAFENRLIPGDEKQGRRSWKPKYWVSESWFKQYSGTARSYPLKLLNRNYPATRKFRFSSFNPDWLRENRSVLKDFVRWYRSEILALNA